MLTALKCYAPSQRVRSFKLIHFEVGLRSPKMPDVHKPIFDIEPDPVGLGFRVSVEQPDGSIEYVTGMGTREQAVRWIENDAPGWANNPGLRLTTPKP